MAFFLAGRLAWPPRGAGLEDMAPGPELGMAPGAGPFGGIPASSAS
jgi:hypothetical protein